MPRRGAALGESGGGKGGGGKGGKGGYNGGKGGYRQNSEGYRQGGPYNHNNLPPPWFNTNNLSRGERRALSVPQKKRGPKRGGKGHYDGGGGYDDQHPYQHPYHEYDEGFSEGEHTKNYNGCPDPYPSSDHSYETDLYGRLGNVYVEESLKYSV